MVAVNGPPPAAESLDDVRTALQDLERHAGRLAATGDPVAATIAACAAVVKTSTRLLAETTLNLQAQPVADIERAVRAALNGLRPAYEQRWRWQRWAALIGAAAAGAGIIAVTIAATWILSASIARRDPEAAVAHWQSWWNTTCGVQSPRRVVIAGKTVCEVPIDDIADKK